jgi:hypothetical protein
MGKEEEALEQNDLGRLIARKKKKRGNKKNEKKQKQKRRSEGQRIIDKATNKDDKNKPSSSSSSSSFFRTHESVMYGMLVSALGVIVGFAWRDAVTTEIQGTKWGEENGYLAFAVFITVVGAIMMIFLHRRMRHNQQLSQTQREKNLIEFVLTKREEESENEEEDENTD